jgi:hypothetical protein
MLAVAAALLLLNPTGAASASRACEPLPARTWTFDREQLGGLPSGWKNSGGAGGRVYSIARDREGNAYLRASSRNDGVQLGIEVEADTAGPLVLSWRWRVWELPAGGDERRVETMDSAASVYAVFGSQLFPRVIKYVWSSAVPVGTTLHHPRSGRVGIVVVASGTEGLESWRTVRRTLTDDYRRLFGGEPGRLRGLGVKSDSDSTAGTARADFDDIQLLQGPSC